MNVYKQPTGEYQKFIKAYALLHGAGKSRQSLIDEGNKNWKELKHNKEALNDLMVKAAQHHPRKRQASILDTFKAKEPVANKRALTQQASASTSAATVFHPSTPDSFSTVEKETFLKDQDSFLVKKLFSKICEPEVYPNVMTDKSIWEEELFIRTCIDTAKSWIIFTELFEKYMDLSQYKRESKLNEYLEEVENISESINGELSNLVSINVKSAVGVSVLAKNAAEKQRKVLDVISLLLRLKAKTDNPKILVSLRRRISQQLQTAAHSYSQPSSEIELQCSNTGSWEAAICYLVDIENNNIVLKKNANHLESSELSSLATLLIDSTAVSLEELKLYLPERYKRYIPHTVMKQIIVHLPVMHVKKSKEQFLVNVHQIDFHCTELNKIFETQSEDDWCDLTKQSTDECQKGISGGRIRIEKIFSSIPDVATEVSWIPCTRTQALINHN